MSYASNGDIKKGVDFVASVIGDAGGKAAEPGAAGPATVPKGKSGGGKGKGKGAAPPAPKSNID
jgi:hypothetical protein